jgi:hypothetical protein
LEGVPSSFAALNEPADGSVVGFFHGGREITGREFAVFAVVLDALAAQSLAGAGIIGTRAAFQVFFQVRTLLGHFFVRNHFDFLLDSKILV